MTKGPSLTLMEKTIPFCPVLGKTFGICGALLLQQIHFSCSTSDNWKEGHLWVWSTTKEWADQLQVFDERTIRYTLKRLRDEGVVQTGSFNKLKYDRTLWYRVDYPVMVQRLQKEYPLRAFFPDPSGKIFRILSEAIPATIPESTEKSTTKIEDTTLPGKTGGEQPTEEADMLQIKKNPVTPKGKAPITSAEVLKQLGKSKANLDDSTATGMYKIWVTTVPLHNEGVKFVAPFTMQEKGQVVRLAKVWGNDSGPVLEYVLSNWIRFAKTVKSQTGLKSFPETPSIGFLVKYSGEAKSFWVTQTTDAPTIVVPSHAQAPVKLVEQDEEQHQLLKEAGLIEDTEALVTIEEIMARRRKSLAKEA